MNYFFNEKKNEKEFKSIKNDKLNLAHFSVLSFKAQSDLASLLMSSFAQHIDQCSLVFKLQQ